MLNQLPPSFVHTIKQTFGEGGRLWLQNLPHLLEKICVDHDLVIGDRFGFSYNYVVAAQQKNGRDVVLKLGVPSVGLTSEITALRLYNGRGAVQLIEGDTDQGVILLNRIRPGQTMHQFSIEDNEAATVQVAQVMQQLWRPVPEIHPFLSTTTWGEGLQRLRQHYGDGSTGPFPVEWVARAEKMYATAATQTDSYVLLHGDLHQHNVLSATNGQWLAIDPKGIIGPPIYDVGALLRHPRPWLLHQADMSNVLSRRIAIFAEQFGFDQTEIKEWAIAQAVLLAWWMIEHKSGGWEWSIPYIDVLDQIKTR